MLRARCLKANAVLKNLLSVLRNIYQHVDGIPSLYLYRRVDGTLSLSIGISVWTVYTGSIYSSM